MEAHCEDVIDAAALEGLTGDVEDVEFVRTFTDCYRRMLPGRVHRVVVALQEPDLDEARDAVLSLKVSSATVGAVELADLGRMLHDLLRRGEATGARVLAGRLDAAAHRADRALAAYLSS